jgi:hypothetical protein
MSKKTETPSQLPEITVREPTKQYGYFEVKVPISWKDFTSTDKVKTLAQATWNIVDAVKDEYKSRALRQKAAEAEARVKAREEAEAEKADRKKAEIQKILDDEPDAVLAKRKEIGDGWGSAEAAAAIIWQERQAPPKKPDNIPKTAAQAAASDYSADDLPESITGTNIRFYKSEYGWSMYVDREKEDPMIQVIFDWLIAIPMEMRHRRGTKYPAISRSGRYIMCNEYEKTFITDAAKARGLEVIVKED